MTEPRRRRADRRRRPGIQHYWKLPEGIEGALSRDTTDLLIIARDMQKAGAGIRSLAEPFLDTTSDFAEIVFAILGVAAKLERRRIVERTARGRADAKAKGVKFGRKPTLTPHQQREAIKRRDVDGETLRSIARSYNVSPQTISRLTT
jgi:DNA invertase Pin-like site-specific DNA recombinase